MKNAIRFVVPLLLLAAAPLALAATDAQKSFEQLKSLEGTWEGKNSQGEPLTVIFRNTAGGTAIMSEIKGTGEHDMITMFHMDGDRLLMTHYCSAGNQPRMQATQSADGKSITFNFVDGTNLDAGAHPGHMQQLVLSMPDANHHIEEWNFLSPESKMQQIFDLHRKN